MNTKQSPTRRSWLAFVVAISFCLLLSANVSGQDAIKLMIEQIAKFEIYLDYLKKGYNIVHEGLTFIGDIKKGDLDMHTNYFNSLETVNPTIKKYDKVTAIIAMQLKILSDYKTFANNFKKSGMFSGAEIKYLSSVYNALLNDLSSDVEDLVNVITDRQLKMKDDERLDRINKLYSKVSDMYDFFYSFNSETNTQLLQRQKSLNEIKNLQKLYQP